MTEATSKDLMVYVGTRAPRDEGIYVFRMDGSTGKMEFASSIATGLNNPSYIAIDHQHRYLYAGNEVGESSGGPEAAVTAFAISPGSGELSYLDKRATGGEWPCFLAVDKTDKFVLVSNYLSGSVAVLPIQGDGRLGQATDLVQHQGSSIIPERQKGPHPHSVQVDPANRYVIVPDLGVDKVFVYRLDLTEGKLIPNEPPSVQAIPGSGPRHFDFHPSGRYAYLVTEIDSTIITFEYDPSEGTLEKLQTVSALPQGFDDRSHCADLHVSPSGNFIYGSNRGHDSIVIFAIDQETGRLTYVDHEPTQGRVPRNFIIDPTGTWLLASNQESDTILTFKIDQVTGKLEPSGHVAEAPMPACLKLTPIP